MCRLFAYRKLRNDPKQLPELLVAFRDLAEHGKVIDPADPGHKSGWGIVGYRDQARVCECRLPTDASTDPEFLRAMDELVACAPDAVIAHLRKATCGEPSVANTHPFVVGAWSMGHNGNAGPIAAPCYEAISSLCKGENDSERYMQLFLRMLGTSDAVADTERVLSALTRTIATIRREADPTSLSAVLTDGTHIYVLRAFTPERVRLADEYYTLFLGRTSAGAVAAACSEPLGGELSWELLPNDTVAIFDVKTGSVSVQPLPTA